MTIQGTGHPWTPPIHLSASGRRLIIDKRKHLSILALTCSTGDGFEFHGLKSPSAFLLRSIQRKLTCTSASWQHVAHLWAHFRGLHCRKRCGKQLLPGNVQTEEKVYSKNLKFLLLLFFTIFLIKPPWHRTWLTASPQTEGKIWHSNQKMTHWFALEKDKCLFDSVLLQCGLSHF